jgi:hypothetical protein
VITQGKRLQLKSQPDSITGYAFTKEFYGNPTDTTVHVKYTIANVSEVEKTVAAWEVTRMPSSGFSFFRKAPSPVIPFRIPSESSGSPTIRPALLPTTKFQ